jgi:hypothetical protein
MGGDWTNLATLGCIDPGRRRVQLLGDHDPVWPVYAMHDKVRAYEAQINARVPAGQHEVFIDTQCVQHAFTKAMISKVLADMGAP